MISQDKIAHDASQILAAAYEAMNFEVVKFTPSINNGCRYIGVKKDDQEFLVQIDVTEAK